MFDAGRISDIETYKEGILAREAQTSTGLGDGIAMPHAKTVQLKKQQFYSQKPKGVDYEALDGQPTYLFFMIAAPEGANDTHLQALAALSRLLIDADFVGKLKEANTPEEVQDLFQTAEEQKKQKKKQNKKHKLQKLLLIQKENSLLPLQLVQQGSLTLTWQKML